MRYELGKVLSNPYVLLLMTLAIVLNGILFYQHCGEETSGYTFAQVAEKYKSLDTLETELQALETAILSNSEWAGPELITGSIYREYALDQAVLERVAATRDYQDFLRMTYHDAVAKRNSGLFTSSDGFIEGSLERVAAVYQGLEDIAPETSFSGGVEALLTFSLPDLLSGVFSCMMGLLLVTAERINGTMELLRPLPGGRYGLYWRKYGALVVLTSVSLIALYSTNALIAQTVFGFGDLTRPIQSVYGFLGCPYRISVGGGLAIMLSLKLIWVLTIGGIFFFLCCATNRVIAPIFCAVILLIVSAVMIHSSNLWLRWLSPGAPCLANELLSGCSFLNLWGHPVDRFAVVWVSQGVFLLLGSFGGGVLFGCRPSVVAGRTRRAGIFHWGEHTRLLSHETYKIFIEAGGLLVLVMFLCVQVLSYRNFYIRQDLYERGYREYSAVLSGAPSEEKEVFLREEAQRYESIRQTYAAYAAAIDPAYPAFLQLTQPLIEQLEVENAFHAAYSQYEQLTTGQSYVYITGYERLLGPQGLRDTLVNLGKLFFVLALSLSGTHAVEKETGVILLQRAAGAEQIAARKKTYVSFFLMLLASIIAFVPQIVTICQGYGLPQITAQANCLDMFAHFPNACSFLDILLLSSLILFFLGCTAMVWILWLSQRIPSTLTVLLVSIGTLSLPIIIALFLV